MNPRNETVATSTTNTDASHPPSTIKGLQWKLLYGNHRGDLDQGWEALAEATGAPGDVKAVPLEEDLPVGPFNQALAYIDEQLGSGDGAKVREIAVASARRWASMYRTLVDELQGRPGPMLELFCSEVHPWAVGDPGAARVEVRRSGSAEVTLSGGLPVAFRAGLLEGFVGLTGVEATVEPLGDDRFRVAWHPAAGAREPAWRVFVQATRARFLSASLVPVLLGTAVAWWLGSVDPVAFAVAAAAAVCLHLAANALNDVVDHLRGVDPANLTPTPFSGGSRAIQVGMLDWRGMVGLAAVLGIAGVGLGLALVALTGPWVLTLGVVGVALGYAYSAPPLALSHRSLGEVTAALVFGPLMTAGAYAVHGGAPPAAAWLAGLPVGLLMAAIVYAGGVPDAPWDARTGKRTLVVALGDRAPAGLGVLFATAYLALGIAVALGALPSLALLGVATIPLAWLATRGVARTWEDAEAVAGYQGLVLVVHGLTGALVAAGVVLEVVV